MGKIRKVEKVKLIVGMISSEKELFGKIESALEKKYGAIDYQSKIIKFTFTKYYQEEMGKDLLRKFISFKKLINQDDVAEIKLFTNKLEDRFAVKNKRKINIDPGYISLGKLVLATTKDQQHRMYLKKGIYAEVTLRYVKDSFKTWPWTYPDYRTKKYRDILNDIRSILKSGRR